MNDVADHNSGTWCIVNAVHGPDQVVMRLRTDRPAEADIDSYSTAVVIKWAYPRTDWITKPPDEIWERMVAFEDAVVELSWQSGLSYRMNISTGVGLREWCYYTKDRERFMRRLNDLLKGHEAYPLAIEFYDDPEWKVWLDLRQAYERTGGEPALGTNQSLQREWVARMLSRMSKWFSRGRHVHQALSLMEPAASQSSNNFDDAWPPGAQYLAVRRGIEDEWQRCEITGAASGLKFVLASEWSEEGPTRHPEGLMLRAWIRDHDGLRQVTPQEYERVHPRTDEERRPFVSLQFHVCADGRHVSYCAFGGGARTYFGGGRCWIDPADPRLPMAGRTL